MILGKFFGAIRAQLNKLANFFWEADPIAQMQYEYDLAVEQLKEGRQGLEQYRGLVERVSRQDWRPFQWLSGAQRSTGSLVRSGSAGTNARRSERCWVRRVLSPRSTVMAIR